MAGGGIRQGALGSSGGGERRTREALPFCVWRSLARRAASPDGHPSAIRQVLRRWASLAIRRHLVGNSAMRRKRAGVDALGNACVHGKMMPGFCIDKRLPTVLRARRSPVRAARGCFWCWMSRPAPARHPSALREDISLGSHSSPLAVPKRRFGEPRCEGSAPGRRSEECAYPCRKGVSICIGDRLAHHWLRIRVARKPRTKVLAYLPERRS